MRRIRLFSAQNFFKLCAEKFTILRKKFLSVRFWKIERSIFYFGTFDFYFSNVRELFSERSRIFLSSGLGNIFRPIPRTYGDFHPQTPFFQLLVW